MRLPQAVRKHDGRLVAFDLQRLAQSIANAAALGGGENACDDTWAFASEIARAVSEFVVNECSPTPATAEIREMTLELLRKTECHGTAEAYEQHARKGAALLFRLRLLDGGTEDGEPWDRRRLLESLRQSGIARDPAGEVAREVERRLVSLGRPQISAALVHALVTLVLHERSFDTRPYRARRISASFNAHVPLYDPRAAQTCPLPTSGPALEALWLQGVHSSGVIAAVKTNALGLDPYPYAPDDMQVFPDPSLMADPQQPGGCQQLQAWAAATLSHAEAAATLWLLADTEPRLQAWPACLARLSQVGNAHAINPARQTTTRTGDLILVFSAPGNGAPRPKHQAPPITLNVGGMLMREGVRDPQRASLRLAQLVGQAAQAHREREEYWGRSATRGRALPLLVAGLWNAGAWLSGKPYDQSEPELSIRVAVSTLVASLHSAVKTLRETTGMNLMLISSASQSAARALWRNDQAHFIKDGWALDATACYAVGTEMKLRPGMEDLAERVEFQKSLSVLFDEPPALCFEAPLGQESEPTAWRDLLSLLMKSGVARARLIPGGSRRGMRLLCRQLREHLEGYPLFERMLET